jgi:predicted transcriptional regulator
MDERIAEADKGIFISAEAMHRWVESWGTENELPPPEPDIFPEPHRS